MQKTIDTVGLTCEEAKRLAEQGKANVLPKSREGGVGAILRRNILTLFNLLNVVLGVLLFSVGSYRNMLFLGVIVSNALIGTVQELRAKRTHDRLTLLSAGCVRTLRDGTLVDVKPEELVLGDVVRLHRGDQIPADAEVLDGEAQADESLLTGESVAVAKKQGDVLYSGSFLTSGGVTARLTAVGAQSYAGKLQLSARRVKQASSRLMRDMQRIIRYASIAILPIGAALYLKQRFGLSLSHAEALTKTVGSVIGMIPEGLILLTSVSLAAGVVKLGRKRALVNQLYGIESLARTDVVCMDKTGTLTSGQMKLEQAIALGNAQADEIARCMNALLSTFQDPTPTNAALEQGYPDRYTGAATAQIPFSSARKWSAATFADVGTVVLGAPEKLLNGDDLALAHEHAAQGLRVMALLHGDAPLSGEALPDGLRPVALLCLRDELRARVTETLRYFEEQGVCLKVISGDSPLTVSCVAKRAGVPDAEKLVDLSALPQPIDYQTLSREYTVFGRVSPKDKQLLVEALKRDGHGVAMIGDGVNDIPALKAADCSIAMAGGSDAACRVSQITLLGADFEAMPGIVLEGRREINNITRASVLFLVKNIYSALISLALLALPYAYPFMPIQLTLVSTLTIGAPSFVLALQPSRERVSGNFLRNVVTRALPGGLCVAVLAVALYVLSGALGLTEATISSLCTMLAGYSGLVTLLLTCLPLNALRAGLVALMTVALAAAGLLFPQLFYLLPVTGNQWGVLLAFALLAPALQIALGAAIGKAGKATSGATVAAE